MKLSAAVILCTKNRTVEVGRFLESLANQTRKPDEVWVIDGAANPVVNNIADKFIPAFKSITYSVVKGDLTVGRNLGIRLSHSDIVFFLDDDLILDAQFVDSIMKEFEVDGVNEIGGVCGNLLGYRRRNGFRQLINKLMFLPADGDGTFKLSGAATWPYGLPEKKKVEFLPGGLTAYRRLVFKSQLFDEALPEFGYTDDVDFSYRVSRQYKNIYLPTALALHERPKSFRSMSLRVLKTWIWAHWRIYLRNRRENILGYFALLVMSFGFVIRFIESHIQSWLLSLRGKEV